MIRKAESKVAEDVRRHLENLAISTHCTLVSRRMYFREAVMVTAEAVIEALHKAGIRFVLMGTYGLTGYRSEPRATQDVDVLVRKRDVARAVRVLQLLYPTLTLTDLPVVARLIDPSSGRPAIDIMKPTQEIYKAVFRHTIPVGDTHEIPDLEMGLVSKFAAMTSPNRDGEKKLLDGGDFMDMVKHNRSAINMKKLKRLADKVYPQGGDEIMQMVADIDAGRIIRL